MTILEIYFDGSCIPRNPGGAMGWGYIAKIDNIVIGKGFGGFKVHSKNTNNKAEYHAVRAALDYLKANQKAFHVDKIHVKGDSQLVINQMTGTWKITSESIKKLALYSKSILDDIDIPIEFIWIPRELNEEADALAYRGAKSAMGITV